ncbi:MAG: Holliday junction resolvase RuvX [Candidatus Sungbacteria bacterium]|uniref:Putative pre-16S rRNA nuclease n=1 Tax=Candidatus Sungiibacteriota bacterium TaxID=2750080 RepID=A0A932YW54_9BACT|nr:Holliday junction resolvase RuvX [Candidatus Sungbacteria bacterium]
MRYLGIDYGKKRIGLAISDPEGQLAFPYGRVRDMAGVVKIVEKEGIGKIVIGVPTLWHGGQSVQIKTVERFAAALRHAVRLGIEFENEMFTSKIAERSSPKDKADAAAAALILQSYLDRQRK